MLNNKKKLDEHMMKNENKHDENINKHDDHKQ
jgi:hypothetical protein